MSIKAMLKDRPWYRLTTHFFLGLFDFGVLSEAGSDSFRRVLLGTAGVMLAFGMLLTRMYVSKYASLSAALTPDRYRLAVVGDEALAIALPMLVIAFATVLVSDSLFPDEIDFRVLLALPVARRTIFLSKLLAVTIFAALFILVTHVAMTPLVVLMSIGRWAEDGVIARLVAYAIASVGASTFVVIALTAVNGILLMCVPRARMRFASTVLRSVMLGALVLSIPLAARLPTIGPLVARESPRLYLTPPVWFVGIERLMLGQATPYLMRLAEIAAGTFIASFVLAVVSYTFLYKRFDRVMLRPADASPAARWFKALFRTRLQAHREIFIAVGDFSRATLARSALHQGVFVAVAACGAALALNSLIGVTGNRVRSAEQAFTAAVIWAVFALVFVMSLAVRAALVLAVEPRANWVFRMTEDDETRAEQMNAVAQAFRRLGVIWPLVLLFPMEWTVLGPQAIRCTSVAFLSGLALVELHMAGWRRIPYTCSYMPGKRFIGHTLLIGFTAFALFTTFGYGLAYLSVRSTSAWLVVMGILGAIALQLRRRRIRHSRETPLAFEDALPNELEPLRLSS